MPNDVFTQYEVKEETPTEDVFAQYAVEKPTVEEPPKEDLFAKYEIKEPEGAPPKEDVFSQYEVRPEYEDRILPQKKVEAVEYERLRPLTDIVKQNWEEYVEAKKTGFAGISEDTFLRNISANQRRLLTALSLPIDAVGNLLYKLNLPLKAGLNALERGEGTAGARRAYIREMIGGREDKDILHFWEPETTTGVFIKGGANLVTDLMTPSMLIKGAGLVTKGLGYVPTLGRLNKIRALTKAGDAIIDTGKMVYSLEKPFWKASDWILKTSAKAPNIALGRLPEKAWKKFATAFTNNPKAQTFMRNTLSTLFGRTDDALDMGRGIDMKKGEIGGAIAEQQIALNNITRGYRGATREQIIRGASPYATGDIPVPEGHIALQKLRNAYVDTNRVIDNSMRNLQVRLMKALKRSPGIPVDDLNANNISNLIKDFVRPEVRYGRVYALRPDTKAVPEIKQILTNAEKGIVKYSAELEKAVASNLGGDARKLTSKISRFKHYKKYYQAVLDEAMLAGKEGEASKALQKLSKNLYKSEKAQMNFITEMTKAGADDVVKGASNPLARISSFKKRYIPEEVVEIFWPKKDIYTLMQRQSDTGRGVALMEGLVGYLEKHPEQAYTNLLKAVPDVEAGQVWLRGIKGLFPHVKMGADDLDFINYIMDDFQEADKAIPFIVEMIKGAEKTGWNRKAIPFWKKMKIFSSAGGVRNMGEWTYRGAPQGVGGDQFLSNMNKMYKWNKGIGLDDLSPIMKQRYRQVISGQQTSLISPEIMANSTIKVRGEVPQKIKDIILKNKSGSLRHIDDHMKRLESFFKSSDDSLRWSIFENEVQRLAPGVPLEKAMKMDNIVKQAVAHADKNTVMYNHLPMLARAVKLWNPFFTFAFRVPEQYVRAAVKNPAMFLRMKWAPHQFSMENLKKEPESFRRNYLAQRNIFADILSPFGMGDVYYGKGKTPAGKKQIVQLSTGPISVFATRARLEDYNAPMRTQVVNTFMNYLGFGGIDTGFKNIAPLSPVIALYSIISAWGGENAAKDLIQNISPTELYNAMVVGSSVPNTKWFNAWLDKHPEWKTEALLTTIDILANIFNKSPDDPDAGMAIARYMGIKPSVMRARQLAELKKRFIETERREWEREEKEKYIRRGLLPKKGLYEPKRLLKTLSRVKY